MEFLNTIWIFFQDQILGMKFLNLLIGDVLSVAGVDIGGRVPVPYTRLPCSSDTDYIRGHGWGRLLSVPAPEEPGGGDCGRTGGDRGYQRGVLL